MSESAVTPAALEQRRSLEIDALLHGGAAVRGAHALIWVRGTDAISFLDALISQSIAPAEPGSVRRSLLLTPQGKMRALLWILRSTDDEVGLVTQVNTVETVVGDLTRFRFRVDAEIVVDQRPTLTLVGASAEQVLSGAEVARPGSGWLPTADGLVASVPFTGVDLPRYVVVGDAAAAIPQTAIDSAPSAYEAVRIAAGEPLGNVDFDESTIAHELGPVDEAVDFTKGCYLGQELIARIDGRGRVTKNLRTIVGNEADLAGATLRHDGTDVGSVTSAAHWIDGTWIGLGLVRHEIDTGETLEAKLDGRTSSVMIKPVPLLSS